MLQFLKSIGRYFGYHRLTFDLDPVSVGRLGWVSILPLSVIVALAVATLASYRTDDFQSLDLNTWRQVSLTAAISIQAGVPLSLAVAFAAGMQKWSRAAGSWMLMFGLTLLLAGAGFGAASVVLAVTTSFESVFDVKVQLWTQWSASLAFLAVGYFYVAYRAGLNRRPRRRFVRRRLAAD